MGEPHFSLDQGHLGCSVGQSLGLFSQFHRRNPAAIIPIIRRDTCRETSFAQNVLIKSSCFQFVFFQIVLTCPLKVTALPLNMDFKLELFTQTRKSKTKSVYQNLWCGECRPVEESWRTTSIMYVWWRLCCHSSTSWSASNAWFHIWATFRVNKFGFKKCKAQRTS